MNLRWPPPSLVLAIAAFLYVPLAVVSVKALTIVFVLGAVVLLVDGLRRRAGHETWRGPPPFALLAFAFAALAVWAAVSAVWAIDAGAALRGAARIGGTFAGVLIWLLAARHLDDDGRRRVDKALLAGFALGGVLLAIEVASEAALNLALHRLVEGDDNMWFAIVNRPMAAFVMAAPLAALLLWRRGWRVVAALASAAVMVIVVKGPGESAQLAVLAALLGGGLAAVAPRRGPLALAVIVSLGILVAPALPRTVLQPVLYENADIRYSGLHRLYIWEFAAERIADKPLSGWGFDASRRIPGGDTVLPRGGTLISLHPHNGSLQVWLELGLPGALLAAAIAALALSGSRRSDDRAGAAAATAATMAGLVIANLSFGLWQTWWLVAMAFAAIFVMAIGRPPAARSEAP